MRKIISIIALIFTVVLVGCSSTLEQQESYISTTETTNTNSANIDTDTSLAFSTYIASGILNTSNSTTSNMNMSNIKFGNNKVMFLTDTNSETDSSLKVEMELDEVNIYFNKLKVFMDEGLESALNINQQASTIDGYDHEMTYSLEDVTYTIYYSIIKSTNDINSDTEDTTTDEESNQDLIDTDTTTEEEDNEDTEDEEADTEDNEVDTEDEEADTKDDDKEETEFQLVGLMVIDNVNYELVGANEIDGEEQKMWFETIDSNDSGNYVRVEIKNEEGEQKFEINTMIDGNEKNAEIKFEIEDDETKVELKLIQNEVESSYEFKKEVEDGETTYKFEYEIGEVKGEVKIIELIDAEGNKTYKYEIEEDGKNKEIDKHDPDDDMDKDNQEDEKDNEGESEEL